MKRSGIILVIIISLAFVISNIGSFGFQSFRSDKTVFADSRDINKSSINTKKNTGIKLMTYNIHRGVGSNGKLNLAATADVIGSANMDIVALQEVERFSPRTNFKDEIGYLSSRLGMSYAYGKSLNILMGEYGNGLLSKYPIEEHSTIKLPSIREQRTVLRAVINIDGQRLAVYNVHLGLNQTERYKQVKYIMELLASEKLDYVLMGDMNSTVDKLSLLTKIMKDSIEGSVKHDQGTIEENGARERIDYIFLSKNMKTTSYKVISSDASDHYPVVSEAVIR